MLILGIDTSCDDTSAALLEFGEETPRPAIINNVVSSQHTIHRRYGGIVPELASRKHIETIQPVVHEALGVRRLEELDAVAVCAGPGLIGSLLVGSSFGKSLAYARGIPLAGVNHLEGHLLSVFLESEGPEFPYLALLISGGHTSIFRIDGYLDYTELGRTRDDAAGEAYDKVSKLMGLGYPGGPLIDKLAGEGDPESVKLPRAYLPDTLDFSFSGMKTAVMLALRDRPETPKADMAASFQAAMLDVLVRKAEWAIKKTGIKRLALSGGVAANGGLRDRMAEMAGQREAELFLPSLPFCTDNAAMIALAGYHNLRAGNLADLALNPKAHLPIGRRPTADEAKEKKADDGKPA